jgi:2'-5' RNA ligase
MKLHAFIAIVVPAPLAASIVETRNEFSARYGTIHGIRTPPHITLVPPFYFLPEERNKILQQCRNVAENREHFEIALSGYGHFANKVIFIHVEPSSQLDKLQSESTAEFGIGEARRFHPHITIAHRDLDARIFQTAWTEMENKSFRGAFKCESISMLVHRDGSWVVDCDFRF